MIPDKMPVEENTYQCIFGQEISPAQAFNQRKPLRVGKKTHMHEEMVF